MAVLTEEDYLRIYRGTGLSKRELERLLRSAGASRSIAVKVASKCGRPMPTPIIKQKTLLQRLIDRVIF
ncbi:hypothetical protein [Syntrophorhabdus aromaticivorans]|uniref:hypothetical protein n=1 Tax=Syntrophorhabdus aromaticivorans TaxID=328301 RepID=UPI00041437EA|nr:hypothetical protein [Syntrophorhabdus aromaticivorans]